MMKNTMLIAATTALLLFGCTKEQTEESPGSEMQMSRTEKMKSLDGIQQISFTVTNLFPEGVVYDPFNNHFYVSSVTTGDIGIVRADGTYEAFITDPALTATTGLEIDLARKRLYVSNSTGSVGVYDLNTGERIDWINLVSLSPGSPVFINDIALDPQGNAYVTNSSSPLIYKITPDGEASIFINEPSLALQPGQFGFNGIEYGNTGFLLVAYSNNNQVIKFPIDDPSGYSMVTFNTMLNRPDGLLLSKDGKQLIVVNNAGGGNGMVMSFMTDDQWETAALTDSYSTGSVFPTTATSDGKNVYVLYAFLNRRNTGHSVFRIQELPFEKTRPF